jgi:hypothetical protein
MTKQMAMPVAKMAALMSALMAGVLPSGPTSMRPSSKKLPLVQGIEAPVQSFLAMR